MPTHKDDVLLLESTLTSRGQTTIPSPIRKALGLDTADKIRFTLSGDNTVTLARATPEPSWKVSRLIWMLPSALTMNDREAKPARHHQ